MRYTIEVYITLGRTTSYQTDARYYGVFETEAEAEKVLKRTRFEKRKRGGGWKKLLNHKTSLTKIAETVRPR